MTTYLTYQWSSLGAYIGHSNDDWLKPERVRTMPPEMYRQFLADYEGRKAELEDLKVLLAE